MNTQLLQNITSALHSALAGALLARWPVGSGMRCVNRMVCGFAAVKAAIKYAVSGGNS